MVYFFAQTALEPNDPRGVLHAMEKDAPDAISYEDLIRVLDTRGSDRCERQEQSYYFELIYELFLLDAEVKAEVARRMRGRRFFEGWPV